MESIGIRELRENAGRWLRRVRAGESFVVTDRGRPIARLVPLEDRRSFQALLESGGMRAAERSLSSILDEIGPAPQAPSASEVLSEQRRDER